MGRELQMNVRLQLLCAGPCSANSCAFAPSKIHARNVPLKTQ
jgi:hypothetical protein